jgi:CubicO group peptidase (beta-lactamase class C family)
MKAPPSRMTTKKVLRFSWDAEARGQLSLAPRPFPGLTHEPPMHQSISIRLAGRHAGLVLLLLAPLTAQTWRADPEVSLHAVPPLYHERAAQGNWPQSITVRRTPAGADVFQLLWSTTVPAGSWSALVNLDSATYQQRAVEQAALGYYPVVVDAAGEYPNERYAAVWTRFSTPAYLARHRLTSAQYQTEFNAQVAAGLRLFWVGVTGSGSNARFAALWQRDGLGYNGTHDNPIANLRSTLDAWRGTGQIPACISVYGTPSAPLFAGVSVVSSRPWSYLVGVDHTTLCAELPARARNGERAVVLEGWDTPSGPRYVAVFAADGNAPVFRATGFDQPDLAPLDTAMRTFMQSQGITQASLAVTQRGRLVHARGYTNAPAAHETTQPYSRFRIASISKPLTAVGVMKLVQSGRINLDQRVATILDMRGWVDARAQAITVRHLLTHFGGFDRGRSGDPMFMDHAVAATLGRPLPTDPQMVIDFWSRQRLDFTPGTVDPAAVDTYSNFGYCLLGRVIERVTGLPYEEYMLREVFEPVGAGLVRVGALRCQQMRHEADYDAHGLVPSVMGAQGPSQVEFAYGGFNQRTMDAHGGFVCSAIDLARFIVAFDDPNRSPLLSRASIDTMWSRPSQITGNPAVYYGAGWAVRDLGNGTVNAWHNGSLPGTYTMMARRADGIDFVVLLNKTGGTIGSIDAVVSNAIAQVTRWPAIDQFATLPGVRSLGTGCAGTAGIPGLHVAAGSIPLPGNRVVAELTQLPSAGANLPLLLLGASATSYRGVPLPISLTFLGAPCALRVSLDLSIALTNQAGTARLALDVPNASAFLGSVLFLQGLVTDSANALGVVLTAGSEVRIGAR